MRKPKILIVEDSLVHQKIAQLNLQRYDADISVVSDGVEAVQAATNESYDLVLLDVMMPNLSGIDATRTIRELEAGTGRHAIIVAVTASPTQKECLEAGMDDFITKPADYDRIMAKWLPNCRKLT